MDEPGCIPGLKSPGQHNLYRPQASAILFALLYSNGMTPFVLCAINWRKKALSQPDPGEMSGVLATRPGTKRALLQDAMAQGAARRLLVLLLACWLTSPLAAQSAPRTIHVFVALADNKNQGIVPVAAVLGNGEDPVRNLYWGSAYGVKTYFARSADWQMIASGQKPRAEVLERCIFKHRTQDVYLIADAYRGSKIQQTILDFLEAAAGGETEGIQVKSGTQTLTLNGRGGADLIAYAGHDGLMDFSIADPSPEQERKT